ncbi:acyl-CoA synthetase [Ideonella sp. A 288]|uniref:acyl-CoA synthetase n=1 Tax=Ideonella sp. A 288 TaxID=1962181 RepID=UPI000B4BF894|nr:acyl-CoA synthetase [Ideonella sp. A 288]
MSAPATTHVLDRLIGTQPPVFATPADIAAFERQAPWPERVAAASTYEALRLGAAIDPQAPAIQFLRAADPDEVPTTLSHAQFFARVTQAANAFHALGVGPGQVVSFLLPLLPQAFVALYGAQAAGIANPVNPLLSAAQLAEILRAAGTRVLVTVGPSVDAELWAKVASIRAQLPSLQAVLVVGGAEPGAADLDALLDAQPADRLVSGRSISAEDIAGYFHTGGTTGTPKLVRHTHANQVYQAWALRLMGIAEPGRALLFGLPLFHVGGSLTQGLSALANGGSLVVLTAAGWRDPRAVRNVWRLVQRYRPAVFGAVPTVLAAALQVPRDGADVSSLRRASGGGAAIPVAVTSGYEAMGLPVLEVYGMTETASVHCMGYPDLPRHAGSVGRPLPHSRVRVVRLDADGRFVGDCAPGEIGVVAMAGPGVFSGYLSESHNRQAFVEPGWVNSGDLGRLDADGQLWITGRAKDVIIRGGHNIDPQPIEELLYQHPSVALAAVVGQPDGYAGELPVAYVQPRPGHTVDAAALTGFLRERTPERAAVPVAIHAVDPMPQTAVGKIFKPALRVDAMRRATEALLADLPLQGALLAVQVLPHPAHGQVLQVTLQGAPADARAALAAAIDLRLDPLTLRHEVLWA